MNSTPLLSSNNRFSILPVDNIPEIDEPIKAKVVLNAETVPEPATPNKKWPRLERLHCSRFVINALDETEARRRSLNLKIELQMTQERPNR
jgi:hypothetical protein